MPLVAETLLQLVRAARRHDARAWDSLLQQHQLPLFAYAMELVRHRESALDLVQETFAAAVRHLGSLRDDAKFKSWLFGIAHQKCLQHFRRTRRHGNVFSETDIADDEAPDEAAPDPRDLVLRAEESTEFFALVERLPDPQREALLLHVLEDFSLEEVAEIAGVPVGTVKSRLYHAKRALRQLVEEKT
jgi:RNA polymerase sigma-70 factor, ECF subfamily